MNRLGVHLAFLTAALLTGVAAIAPPMDRLADNSFAWHMLQHLLLLYLVALFFVLSRPFDTLAALLPKRTIVGTVRALRPLHAAISAPLLLIFFIATLWLAHFSPLYETALQNVAVHVVEHAAFLAAGVAFWIPIVAPAPLRPIPYPGRLLYLALALPQGALLGMAILNARLPLYPHYITTRGSVASALYDQRDAASLMWIGGGLIVFIAFLATLGAWARREMISEPT
ncbi:MAG: cytochrome c oxidase assembly protein [Candidatus Eremiobacteraeota bacterium]|nr:cytochrome c oxidase assembly protein [Candidatus Eremiobacteraeota bacterium]